MTGKTNRNNTHTKKNVRRPTPAKDAEFQYISANVSVEYFNQSDVHVDRFQPHPGESCKKEEMQQGCKGHAEPIHVKRGDPAIQEEDEVQEQQGCTQVHQDFGGIIPSQFSEKGGKKEDRENYYCKYMFSAQAVNSLSYTARQEVSSTVSICHGSTWGRAKDICIWQIIKIFLKTFKSPIVYKIFNWFQQIDFF